MAGARLIAGVVTALLMGSHVGTARGESDRGSPPRWVAVSYGEPKQTEFLKAVLRSLNLSYSVDITQEGERVTYIPPDPKVEREIQNRVSQYWFVMRVCKGLPVPSPDQPAASELSCKK